MGVVCRSPPAGRSGPDRCDTKSIGRRGGPAQRRKPVRRRWNHPSPSDVQVYGPPGMRGHGGDGGSGADRGRRRTVRGAAAPAEGPHGPELRLPGPARQHEHLHAAPLLRGRGGPAGLRPGGASGRLLRGDTGGAPRTAPPVAARPDGTASDGTPSDGTPAAEAGRRGGGAGRGRGCAGVGRGRGIAGSVPSRGGAGAGRGRAGSGSRPPGGVWGQPRRRQGRQRQRPRHRPVRLRRCPPRQPRAGTARGRGRGGGCGPPLHRTALVPPSPYRRRRRRGHRPAGDAGQSAGAVGRRVRRRPGGQGPRPVPYDGNGYGGNRCAGPSLGRLDRPLPRRQFVGTALREGTALGATRGEGRTVGGGEERRSGADRCAADLDRRLAGLGLGLSSESWGQEEEDGR